MGDTKNVFRQKIDDSILTNIRKKIIKYLKQNGITNCDEIEKRMINNVGALYVENLLETKNVRMVQRKNPPEIAIDKTFCIFDQDGNFVGFDRNLAKLIESQLGHELLHAASRDGNRCGIKYSGDETGLNEGITQLITENIFGYVVSSNSDNYHYLKKYAKIFEATFGKRFLLEAYFNNPTNLENAINSISNNYYDIINSRLSHACACEKIKVNLESYYETITRDLIINVIVPNLRSKTPEEANNYLKNISLYFSDDYAFAMEFIRLIEEYLKMSPQELDNEKRHVSQRCFDMTTRLYIYEICNVTDNILDIATILPDGKVIVEYQGFKHYITDENILDMIYEKIFRIKYTLDDRVDVYEDRIISALDSGNYRINFAQKSKGDLLYKRSVLAFYKRVAKDNNYIILNDVLNVDKSSYIDLDVIKLGDKNNNAFFARLQKYLEEYDFNYTSNVSYEIVDKKTGKKVENKTIVSLVSFAYLWLSAFGQRRTTSDHIPGDASAFSPFSNDIYIIISNEITKSLKTTGNIDLDDLCEKVKRSNLSSSVLEGIAIMFANPISVQIVYKYYFNLLPKEDKKLQTEHSKTFNSNIDYQGVVEARIDELVPSNAPSLYEPISSIQVESNLPGHNNRKMDSYRLFLAIADAVANAVSLDNDVVAATNMNRVLELEYNVITIDASTLNFDTASLDEKVQYCIYNMSHALRRKDINTYNHYRERYYNVLSAKNNGLIF